MVVPGPAHMEAAWKAVRRFLAVTPTIGAPQFGLSVSVKVETVQPTGSFKVRGGLAAVSATLEEDPGRAVVASSAGNHGLGLAYAASKLGAHVTVIVPVARKAEPVRDALTGPVATSCPASALRTISHVTIHLEPESARLLPD